MSGVATGLYNSIFRRNWVFLSAVFAGAFAFEIAFDSSATKIWDTINKGRQWKDIKHKYVQSGNAGEDDDDEDDDE